MAKAKKAETKVPKTAEEALKELQDTVEQNKKEVDKVLEDFRTSFKNLESQLTLLKDRNRLR